MLSRLESSSGDNPLSYAIKHSAGKPILKQIILKDSSLKPTIDDLVSTISLPQNDDLIFEILEWVIGELSLSAEDRERITEAIDLQSQFGGWQPAPQLMAALYDAELVEPAPFHLKFLITDLCTLQFSIMTFEEGEVIPEIESYEAIPTHICKYFSNDKFHSLVKNWKDSEGLDIWTYASNAGLSETNIKALKDWMNMADTQ